MDNNWNTEGNQEQIYQSYQSYQQYQPYQPVQPPVVDETVKISEYLLPLLLCQFIPCAGIIMMIIFAFSKNEKESKKNFCKAYLITVGIALVMCFVMLILWAVILAAAL